MTDWLIGHDAVVRLVAFACVFALMAAWETLAARRGRRLPRRARWPWASARCWPTTPASTCGW